MTAYKKIANIPAYRRAQGKISLVWALVYFLGGFLVFLGVIPSNVGHLVFIAALPLLFVHYKVDKKHKIKKEIDTNG